MAGESDTTVLAVLRHLVDHGPLSRPDLGLGVGLARATTSAVVNDLMRRGLVAEIATPPSGGRGRPVTLLDLDDERHAVAGLEIGFDRILAAVYTPRGRELLRLERPAEVDAVNPAPYCGAPRWCCTRPWTSPRRTGAGCSESG